MSLSDYVLDIALVLLVLRQLRESRFEARTLLLPVGIMTWVAQQYLTSLPTGAHDLLLVATLTAVGAACGVIGAFGTRLRRGPDGRVFVRAGWLAAAIWVASMGFRFGFAVWASHGGGPELVRFSLAHDLHAAAWTDALVLMAFAEVIVRMGLLLVRAQRTRIAATAAGPAAEPAAEVVAA